MLLWRLPPSVRSLCWSNCRRFPSVCSLSSLTRPFATNTPNPPDPDKKAEPLRILFCGADEFSARSLRSLHLARKRALDIEYIEVVHRPGKPAGRGQKEIREVPIKAVACEELRLTTHEIDTFTGWKPPSPYNLIIAVSFGLFVPSRILNGAKYGGLNVHPSLLPDLYGPAPIHHTLLREREHMGVTVQTLHPKHFDQGTILAQTPAPGIPVSPDATFHTLTETLGRLGGDMLTDVLASRRFVPPLENAGWYAQSGGPVEHAEKIIKAHSFVDFFATTASAIVAAHRALGDLWCRLPNGERVILNKIIRTPVTSSGIPGLFQSTEELGLAARAVDGGIVQVLESTVAGGKRGKGNQHIKRVLEEYGRKD